MQVYYNLWLNGPTVKVMPQLIAIALGDFIGKY